MNVSTIMQNLWGSLKRGELVLVERTDAGDQYLAMHNIVTWGLRDKYNILIVDILDSLHLLTAKARLAGIETEVFTKVEVIKIGGRIPVGKVIKTIEEISEPVILTKKFRDVYEQVLESRSPVLTIVLGLEKLLVASEFSSANVHALVKLMSKYVGDERRLTVHLVKTDIIGPERQSLTALLEDMATTVIRVSKKGKATEFHVIKSVTPNLEDMVLRF
ncbi:hypothetical protein X802_04035 [Thermococcus guaymasensis DSM 11113]|uniref:KaiC-like domain-containing protein n=1 Tax=Thermococcus guaymasensis DSM 11113 TaxID=1432656 RepID=A0A0X1KJK9_9EURY|nr:DUF257 family protein [Thermococcus guaymasensis]AJC71427.1 hypothetical protein X802_04035 [Thermococcus guaymasensis DSM 11113]